MLLNPGTVLSGRYEILEKIGSAAWQLFTEAETESWIVMLR